MTMNDNVRSSVSRQLQSALQVRTSGEAARWLEGALKDAQSGSQARLLALYTEASMRLGRLPLGAHAGEDATVGLEGLALEDWTLEDAARATFLLAREDSAGFYGGLGRLASAFISAECRRVGVAAGPALIRLRSAELPPVPSGCGLPEPGE